MGETKLKTKIVSGMFWKFGERIITQGVSFIVSMILARILLPEDYGVVAIITIFIELANVLLTSGMNAALVQKKEVSQLEFSTVFYCNLMFGVVLYGVLFFTAPFIASIYEMPLLVLVIRVFALRLPVSAYQSIQSAYVSRNMKFKLFFFSTIAGTIVSAIVGITMALNGFGVWALVSQTLTATAIDTLVMFITVKWRPTFQFSLSAAIPLFRYGWKVMITDLIGTGFNHLSGFVIGLKYNSASLAYYTKGKNLPQLVRNNLFDTLIGVLFPAMSIVNGEEAGVKNLARRSIRLISYIVFPLMTGMMAVSHSLIEVLYTAKWMGMVPFLCIACIEGILSVPGTITLQALKASGRSDIMLKMEFIKKPILLISLLIAMRYGVLVVAMMLPLNSLIDIVINGICANRIFGYKIQEQLKDFVPSILLAVFMGVLVFTISFIKMNIYLLLILQIMAGILIYILISLITKNENFEFLKNVLLKKKAKQL